MCMSSTSVFVNNLFLKAGEVTNKEKKLVLETISSTIALNNSPFHEVSFLPSGTFSCLIIALVQVHNFFSEGLVAWTFPWHQWQKGTDSNCDKWPISSF